jgi:hypothetical protein
MILGYDCNDHKLNGSLCKILFSCTNQTSARVMENSLRIVFFFTFNAIFIARIDGIVMLVKSFDCIFVSLSFFFFIVFRFNSFFSRIFHNTILNERFARELNLNCTLLLMLSFFFPTLFQIMDSVNHIRSQFTRY